MLNTPVSRMTEQPIVVVFPIGGLVPYHISATKTTRLGYNHCKILLQIFVQYFDKNSKLSLSEYGIEIRLFTRIAMTSLKLLF